MKVITDEKKIDEILERGVKEILPTKEDLKKIMLSGKRLRLYTGIDPTADFIHMGHMIWMKKLRQFQDLGHEVIFMIGGFTAMIGDPDKKYTREPLTQEQVQKNFQGYRNDANKILDFDSRENPVTVLNNYDWLSKLNLEEWLNIASNVTLQHLLSHDMFKNRLENNMPIRFHEVMYPLLQGYDSVHMQVDLEVGGSDQLFNMLTGRILARNLINKEKYVLALKLLTDNSGKKMGKTTNNAISFKDTPNEVYAKIMSFSDEIIPLAYELLSSLSWKDVQKIETKMKEHPMNTKKELAFDITKQMHGEELANRAGVEFSSVVQNKEIPDDIPEYKVYRFQNQLVNIIELVTKLKLVESKGEAKRLIAQGGIKVDQEKINNISQNIQIKPNLIIQVGKRKWAKLI